MESFKFQVLSFKSRFKSHTLALHLTDPISPTSHVEP
jgi:hypothetical protein